MASNISKRNTASDFPCSLIIKTPFPTHRLAKTALKALEVDEELSPLVYRTFSLITPPTSPISTASSSSSTDSNNKTDLPFPNPPLSTLEPSSSSSSGQTVLLTEYRAKTNRMLRVAVNGFMESLGLVLGVMEKLDVDVLAEARNGKKGDSASNGVVGSGSAPPPPPPPTDLTPATTACASAPPSTNTTTNTTTTTTTTASL